MKYLILIMLCFVCSVGCAEEEIDLSLYADGSGGRLNFSVEQQLYDIIFYSSAGEAIKLCHNGDFMVRGKVVTNDMELYEHFKKWSENYEVIVMKELSDPTKEVR